jgi:hypothetical protein
MTEFNETESLDVVFGQVFDSLLCNVHTAMPARVVSFDRDAQTLSVQPVLKRKFRGVDPQPLPQIDDVPVVFPGSGDWWITVDIAVDSYVLLVFAERALESWLDQGGILDPQIARKFDLSDAIAIPGINPSPEALSPGVAADKITIRKRDNSVYVELDALTAVVEAASIKLGATATQPLVLGTTLAAAFTAWTAAVATAGGTWLGITPPTAVSNGAFIGALITATGTLAGTIANWNSTTSKTK